MAIILQIQELRCFLSTKSQNNGFNKIVNAMIYIEISSKEAKITKVEAPIPSPSIPPRWGDLYRLSNPSDGSCDPNAAKIANIPILEKFVSFEKTDIKINATKNEQKENQKEGHVSPFDSEYLSLIPPIISANIVIEVRKMSENVILLGYNDEIESCKEVIKTILLHRTIVNAD